MMHTERAGFRRRVAGSFFTSPHGWVICAVMLGLSACVQVSGPAEKKEAPPLVFPLPPDEARFVYERAIYSNLDIDKGVEEADNSLRNLLTGENSSGPQYERLAKPYGVAVHQGRIFVSDPVSRAVKAFDVPMGRYFRVGAENPGMLLRPIGIDVDGAGNLYVADATAKAIMVYDRDGKFLRVAVVAKIGEPPLFSRLTSVTVDKKGERLYVVDIGGTDPATGPEFHRIRVFDAGTGVHLFDIGGRGSLPGQLNLPRDVAIGKNNELYVVDSGNFRVQVFDAEGKYLRAFGKIGKQLGDFSRPKEIAIDKEGNVYVIDTLFGNFQIFNSQGELLLYIGSRSAADGPALYQLLAGIAVDEDGRIYVVDQLYRKVEIFRPARIGEKEGYLGATLQAEAAPGAKPALVPRADEKLPAIDALKGAIEDEY